MTVSDNSFSVRYCLGVKRPIDFGARPIDFGHPYPYVPHVLIQECPYGHLAPLTGCSTSPKGCDNVYIKIHCIVVIVIENGYKLQKKTSTRGNSI